eukprot:11996024-Alexandrium_andersonii.AAC.1
MCIRDRWFLCLVATRMRSVFGRPELRTYDLRSPCARPRGSLCTTAGEGGAPPMVQRELAARSRQRMAWRAEKAR